MGGVTAAANQQQGSGQGLPMATEPRTGGPGIGPPSDLVQQPTQPAQVSPIVQQMMMRQQQPMFNPQLQGLQQLYSMFNRPQMRMPMQMPVYRNPALSYRPNIQQVQQNLGRVQPSVYKTDLDAARARIAELEAQQPSSSSNSSVGGAGGSGEGGG